MAFETVDIPQPTRQGAAQGPLRVALRETLGTGKAIVIPLNGHSLFHVRNGMNSYRTALKEEGLKVHVRTVAGVIHAWVERIPEVKEVKE